MRHGAVNLVATDQWQILDTTRTEPSPSEAPHHFSQPYEMRIGDGRGSGRNVNPSHALTRFFRDAESRLSIASGLEASRYPYRLEGRRDGRKMAVTSK